MRIDKATSSISELLATIGQGTARSNTAENSIRSSFKEQLQATTEETTADTSSEITELGMTPFLAVALASKNATSTSQSVSQNSDTTATTAATATTETAAATDSSESSDPVAVTYSLDTTEFDPSPAAPWSMTLVKPSVASSLGPDTRAALNAALVKAGVDPSQVKVSYWEELVWYPGGNYINKSITVQTPNGQKVDFDAKATLNSPYVTATTVQQMMNMPAVSTTDTEVS
ncbi:hypothetical protein [uncultured Paludibaculum sp.]|uniref:hypothetical protein n=1 Tax=uncultured Paludibaculum sp. TaxID=1765020 RepID=UPI002AAAEDD3|nr:hypothetical protein [uncultured Paludibaculum sp.]